MAPSRSVLAACSAVLASLTTGLVAAAPAGAVAPVTTPLVATATTVADDLCAFPVTITSTFDGTQRAYFTAGGQLTRIDFHFVEQDVFTANGVTLTGDPFVNEQLSYFTDGQLVHDFEVGVIERVPLPDGSTFLSAGRVDFIPHGPGVIITPDVGRSGNLTEFCDALAG